MTASGRGGPGGRGQVTVAESQEALARAVAEIFVARSQAAAGRTFSVALSGGSTPPLYHAQLVSPAYRDAVDWTRVQFFWGDDRCVPPDDPESNYRLGRETLLDHLPIQPQQVHRMPTELAPEAAADAYEADLRTAFALAPGELPRIDLILLGMGPDGHTASLFPFTAALQVRDRLVVANHVPQLHTNRITLSVPVLNAGATVLFAIEGEQKAEALAAVLEGPYSPDTYPSQLIAPTNGELLWLVDRDAASRLRQVPQADQA